MKDELGPRPRVWPEAQITIPDGRQAICQPKSKTWALTLNPLLAPTKAGLILRATKGEQSERGNGRNKGGCRGFVRLKQNGQLPPKKGQKLINKGSSPLSFRTLGHRSLPLMTVPLRFWTPSLAYPQVSRHIYSLLSQPLASLAPLESPRAGTPSSMEGETSGSLGCETKSSCGPMQPKWKRRRRSSSGGGFEIGWPETTSRRTIPP
jgi:hypothetical protein